MQIFLETVIGNKTQPQDKNKYVVKKGEGIFAVIRNVMKQNKLEANDSSVNDIYKQIKDIKEYKDIKAGQTIDIKPILEKLPQDKAIQQASAKDVKDALKRYYKVKKAEGMYSIIRNALKEKGVYITDSIVNQVYKKVENVDEYKNLKEGQSVDLKYIWDEIPQGHDTKYKVQKGEGIYTIIKNEIAKEKGYSEEALVNRIYASLKDNKEYKYLKAGETIDIEPVLNKLSQDKIKTYTVKKGDTFSKIIRENLDIYTSQTREDLSNEEVDILLQRVANTLGKGKTLEVGDEIDLSNAKNLIKNSQLEELKQVEENYTNKVVDTKTGVSKKVYVSNTTLNSQIKYKIQKGDNIEKIAKRVQKQNKLNVSFKDIQIAIQNENPRLNAKNMKIGQTITIPREFPLTDNVYKHIQAKSRYLRNNLSNTQRQSMEDFNKHISNSKNIVRYQKIAKEADVPIELIIALHWRESTGDFDTYLHNGQKLGKTTTIKPKGVYFAKGKFEEAAIDALKKQSPYKIVYRINQSTKDKAALNAFAERYNGLGAYSAGKVSSYVFAGTTAYKGGKYTHDGVFNSSKSDNQLGTAVIIDYLQSREGRKYLQ